jgi:hypothetical protein
VLYYIKWIKHGEEVEEAQTVERVVSHTRDEVVGQRSAA